MAPWVLKSLHTSRPKLCLFRLGLKTIEAVTTMVELANFPSSCDRFGSIGYSSREPSPKVNFRTLLLFPSSKRRIVTREENSRQLPAVIGYRENNEIVTKLDRLRESTLYPKPWKRVQSRST